MYIKELLLSNYVAESINSNWLLNVSGMQAFINHVQFLLIDSATYVYAHWDQFANCHNDVSNQQLQNHNNPIIPNISTGHTYHPNQQLVFRPPQYI